MTTGLCRNVRRNCTLLSLALLLIASPSLVLAAPPAETVTAAQVPALLKQLSGDKFSERVTAHRQLQQYVARHPSEIPGLLSECEPEAQLRLTKLLEESFLANNNETGDSAEKALESISGTGDFAATDASAILIGNRRLRESRARVAIERLGGRLAYSYPDEQRSSVTDPQVGVGFGEPVSLYTILLSKEWSGEPADLWHLRRLSHYHRVVLYTIRGNTMSLTDLLPLTDDFYGLTVAERGASLGVSQLPSATKMVVHEVIPNTAAAAAGIQPGDVIEKLDEHEIPDFTRLVEVLVDYSPGQAIELQVRRGGLLLTLPVKLTSWRSMPLTNRYLELKPSFFAGPLGFGRPAPPPLPEPLPKNPPPTFELR